jgi:hypothetical protein
VTKNIAVFWDVTPRNPVDLPATLQSSTSQMTGKKVSTRVSLEIQKIIKKENLHAENNKHNRSASPYKGYIVYSTQTHTKPYRLLPANNQQVPFGQT